VTPRVLVTGGSGFIGWYAARLLCQNGWETHVVGRRRPADLPESCNFHSLDLLAEGSTALTLRSIKPTHLLHFAWNTQPGTFWNAPDNLDWLAASVRLYQTFKDIGGRRAVFAGSCAEYEWAEPVLVEDSSPLRPGTLYGLCKDSLRRVLEKAASQDKISFAWGRIFWLYGPREKPGRLVSDLVFGLLSGRTVPCTEGSQCRDFMYAEDVSRAFVELLGGEVTGAVNVASGRAIRVAEIISMAAELIGRPDLIEWGALPTTAGQPAVVRADIGRLTGAVGFVPTYELREGLMETIAWWKSLR